MFSFESKLRRRFSRGGKGLILIKIGIFQYQSSIGRINTLYLKLSSTFKEYVQDYRLRKCDTRLKKKFEFNYVLKFVFELDIYRIKSVSQLPEGGSINGAFTLPPTQLDPEKKPCCSSL